MRWRFLHMQTMHKVVNDVIWQGTLILGFLYSVYMGYPYDSFAVLNNCAQALCGDYYPTFSSTLAPLPQSITHR